jgi:hypothetical protein
MHITDWFSTTWNSVLGHKSSGIVDDFYWQPDQFISGYLSGNFDPNNTESFDYNVSPTDYNNLKGDDDLCVLNGMSFISGSGDHLGHPAFFESDGSDDFIGSCSFAGGGYASDFRADLGNDFTISIWNAMEITNNSYVWSLGSPFGYFEGTNPGIALIVKGNGLELDIGSQSSSKRFIIGEGPGEANTGEKHGLGALEDSRWYNFTFVYDSSNTNDEAYRFYINGVRERVYPPNPFRAGPDNFSGIGLQKVAIGAFIASTSTINISTEGHKFGHFHFYNRALEHSKVRQNYLATNQYYYTPGSGYKIS